MSNIKRDVVNELHASVRKNYKRRRVVIKGLMDLFQADLIDMIPYSKANRNYKYILTVINAFSKYGWAIPLKTKTGKEVTSAMETVLSDKRRNIPRNLQTDNGKEFYNEYFRKLMSRYGINHYSTFSNLKSSIVERFNRTLKEKMWKEFSMQGNFSWLELLPKIINDYNNQVHRTIGMKPSEVNNRNAPALLKTVYNYIKIADPNTKKYKVGDHVRISKHRHAFTKNYTPNWTNEVFTIHSVRNTYPTTYLLKDASGETLLGGFYREELQQVKHPDVYLVEKVLRRKGNQVFVKWLGFGPSHNSWISKTNVL